MKENLMKFGTILTKAEQKTIQGGEDLPVFECLAPYFNLGHDPCIPGYSAHPVHGLCICCQNSL